MAGTGVVRAIFLVLILVLAPAVSLFISDTAGSESALEKVKIEIDIGYDEGYFTENLGQWNADLYYVGATSFGHIGFGAGCMYLNFVEISNYDKHEPSVDIDGQVLKYVFESANAVEPRGVEDTGQGSNYFLGRDGPGCYNNVRSYREVFYENLWDGIDLRYFFTAEGPKYEFVLQPGADPSDIQVSIEGHSCLELVNGELAVGLSDDRIIYDGALSVFYKASREPIKAKFTILDGDKYTFDLGSYDRSQTIVIDPLVYSTYVSGSNWEHGRAVAYDSGGNIYITGQTISNDFPTTTGAYNETYNNKMDVYVFKLNPSGTTLVYSTYLAGSDDEWGLGINVDAGGNAYVTGCTKSTDFPITAGAYDESHSSDYDVFVTKLNSAGSGLVYSTYIGGTGADYGYSLELDSSNYAYITGRTASSTWPTTSGAYDENHNGMDDAYVLKLNVTGDKIILSTLVGGLTGERGFDLELDSGKNIFVTGYTDYTNTNPFPVTSGAFDETHNGGEDMIVFKLNASFDKLLYSTYIGSSGTERGMGIEIDSSGYAYVGGWTKNSGFPTTPGANDTTFKGATAAVALKLNTTGTGLVYSTYVCGSGNDDANDIAVDSGGNAFIVGETTSSDFPTTPDAENGTHSGGILDLFLTKVSADGSKLEYSTFRGGGSADYAYAVALDAMGTLYIGGTTSSSNFPTTPGVVQPSWKGSDDAIAVKFSFKTQISPPRNLHGDYGGSFVDLQWDPPENMGSTGITGYDLYRGLSQGTEALLQSLGNVTAYNDTSVTPGKVYFYYVIAKNATGESYPSNTFRAADGIPPVITIDYTPTTATTGDELIFAADVIDNILLDSVFVEYWYGSGSKTNVTMVGGTGHYFSKTITVPHTLEILHYMISANDTADNWRVALQKDVAVVDNDKPVFGTDNTSAATTTASELYFETEVTDNIAVYGCWLEYWYGTGMSTNVSMNKFGSDLWTNTIITKNDTTEMLHYIFHANDTSDNWRATTVEDVSVSDLTRPTIIEDLSSDLATTGDDFAFSLSVSDNIGIDSVFVEYWYGTDLPDNSSMAEQPDGSWELMIQVPHALDTLHYIFHFADTSSNWNETGQKNVPVSDNDGPGIADNSPTTATTGEDLTFSVTVMDNILVENVYVEYWFGTSVHKNATMVKDTDYEFTISIPDDSLDELHYAVYAVDSGDNWNGTVAMTVVITDNDAPGFGPLSFIAEADTGSDYEVSASATDNIAVDNITLTNWFEGESNTTEYMVYGSGKYASIISVPADSVKQLHFYLTAVDTSGNTKRSIDFSVKIKDRTKPTIDPIDDLNITEGGTIDITATASDNIGVVEYIWAGAPFNTTTNILSGTVTTPGTYEIIITVVDDAGNSAYTRFTLLVKEKDGGSGSSSDDKESSGTTMLIAIIVVVAVVVLVVLLLFLKQKKKGKDVEEPGADSREPEAGEMPEAAPEYQQPEQLPGAEQPQLNGYAEQPAVYPTGEAAEQYPQMPQGAPGEVPQLPIPEMPQEPAEDYEVPENTDEPAQAQFELPAPETPPAQPAMQEQQVPPQSFAQCPFCGAQVQFYAPSCTGCNNTLQW